MTLIPKDSEYFSRNQSPTNTTSPSSSHEQLDTQDDYVQFFHEYETLIDDHSVENPT